LQYSRRLLATEAIDTSNYPFIPASESKDLLDQLSDAEESKDLAQRVLLVKLAGQYHKLYWKEMAFDDCVDYAQRQVDKITHRIETRINNLKK
tara:strand:+ start:346 stop:624 length:279 start_codon:yes stop_codon:yes gene_type:complete